ncbi:MAG TPA: DUF4397 domain-containing protein [Casimicrobiaceae bacterium]|nr:DUF4397 domain-containing protein [Casimicrobiaceae bacterium]
MTARRAFCALLCLSALSLAGCDSGNGIGAAAGPPQIRVINLLSGAPGITVTLDNDSTLVSGLAFENLSQYMQVDQGVRVFTVSIPGGTSNLITTTSPIALGVNYTFVVYGTAEAAQSRLIIDTVTLFPSQGTFDLRALNLANGTPAVDVYLTAPGADISLSAPVIESATSTLGAFGTINMTGPFELRITPANTKDVVFDALDVNIPDAGLTQIIVYSTGSTRLVRAALLNNDNSGTGQVYNSLISEFKFVNASAAGSPLNVFVDGVLTLANVPYAGVSSYQVTGAGTRNITVQATATPGANLLTIVTSFEPASDSSIVGSGPGGDLRGLVLSDDNSPPAAGRARIRFVNASPDLTAMDVYVNFVRQFGAVASNTASPYTELVADATGMTAYEFDFNVAGTNMPVLQLPGVTITSGKTYSVYVVGPLGALQGVVVADD